MLKIHINYTHTWMKDSIKEAQEYLKDFVVIDSSKVSVDISDESMYDISRSLSWFTVKTTVSLKSQLINFLGKPGYDYNGLIVDKEQAREDVNLYGQHTPEHKTIEVYAKRTARKWGMSRTTYTLIHEIFHALASHHGFRDTLHEYVSENSSYDGYRDLVRTYLIVKPKYKYFKAKEVEGLSESFVYKLDRARGAAGIPFVITSGFRSEAKNEAVGGVSASWHTKGLAADIRCRNATEQYKIVKGAMEAGIGEITIYTNSNHVHLADDPKSPTLTPRVK